ncbi:transporter substrate-binding domain-containing protein [Terasakiella sp. A23]|uniref:substrate-binding periplasmic protein n=1 Tax=Terasakiella sp. FCG-A23 TaxID=3080561 RepID=UPI002954D819|nr:transporter substrate-binding domain-containing protein [Terasakiella sp. A23]MDV7338922.1 transporter substrate-binding domain-containing protein [Terasakiella sp. A23]
MKKSAFLIVFMIAMIIGAATYAADMRVMGHRVPPFTMHDEEGKVQGLSADLFQLVHQQVSKTESMIHILPVTFNRLYTELQKATRRVGITIGRNAKREKLFKWVGPYLTVNLGVIAKKKKKFKFSSIDDLKAYKIATIENTAPEQALRKMGMPLANLKRDLFPQKNIYQIHNDHVDLLAYPLQATSYLMKQNNIDGRDYEEVFPLRQIDLYFAFSKDFDETEIQTYQKALEQVMASQDFADLRRKYTLNEISTYIDHQD